MYRPQQFDETRPEVLLSAMRSIRLAAIVTPHAGGIEVTHAPVVVRQEEGGAVALEMHFARANAHWKAISEEGLASVAIFQGPHAYVSPSWYPSKAEHGKVVPTWTYIAVHAHGTLRPVADEAWLRAHLEALTDDNERERDAPWAVGDAPDGFIGTLSRGIVGLRMEVARLEGAWKINQHKAEGDREGTRAGLAGAGPMGLELSQALADSLAAKAADQG